MNVSVIQFGKEWLFVRHRFREDETRPTLLFLHGLGESGLSFIEAFEADSLDPFNLVVPDLLGFGRSSPSSSAQYSFECQIDRLWKLIDHFCIQDVRIVGHSMGGDIGTWLCADDRYGRIQWFVNVEGNLTPDDLIFSQRVLDEPEKDNFNAWFYNTFITEQWEEESTWSQRYVTSLRMCDPEAFKKHAEEMVEKSTPAVSSNYGKTTGLYLSLRQPCVYCRREGLEDSTQALLGLHQESLRVQYFSTESHWIMIDQPKTFYQFLVDFASDHQTGNSL